MRDSLIEGSKALQNLDIDFNNTAIQIKSDYLHIYPFKPGEKFILHAHPNFEFHYIAAGKGKVGLIDMDSFINTNDITSLPGLSHSSQIDSIPEYRAKMVSNKNILKFEKSFDIKAGDLFINPPRQFHWQTTDNKDPIIEYSLRCSFNVLDKPHSEMLNMAEEFLIIRQLLSKGGKGIYPDKYGIKELFENIFDESFYKMPGYIAKVKYLLQELIISFARHVWDKKENLYNAPEVDFDKKRLQTILDYILENMYRNITIEELSQIIYMSPRTLSRFIKKHTGESVHQYILNIKITQAIKIISQTNCTLSKVAMTTGFSSSYHLSNSIKRITGKSPSQYR